jgi:dihydroflavonol-4-reductase
MLVVTGATGHIGNVLVRGLLAQGRQVRALVLPFEDTCALAGLDVELAAGDVRDPGSLRQPFAGVSVVYHLAGLISILPGRAKALHATNVVGTRNVIQACLDSGVERMVYVSSVHALVEPLHGTAITEEAGCDSRRVAGAYAKSKAQATLAVREAAARGLDAVIIFPSGIIGPHDFNRSEMGQVILDFARRRLPAYVDGAYDFVDVRDVADGIVRAGLKGRTGEGYILSGGILPVPRLMELLQELTGVRAPSLRLPRRVAMAAAVFTPLFSAVTGAKPRFASYAIRVLGSNCLISCAKARRELDYAPRPIEETLADTVQWFRMHGMI